MSKTPTKVLGPITFEMKVHVSNDDKGLIAAATYSFRPGRVPTADDVMKGIARTLQATGKGWQLMSPDDFFNRVIVKEATGRVGKFAVPDSFEYERAALQAIASQIDVGGEEE